MHKKNQTKTPQKYKIFFAVFLWHTTLKLKLNWLLSFSLSLWLQPCSPFELPPLSTWAFSSSFCCATPLFSPVRLGPGASVCLPPLCLATTWQGRALMFLHLSEKELMWLMWRPTSIRVTPVNCLNPHQGYKLQKVTKLINKHQQISLTYH